MTELWGCAAFGGNSVDVGKKQCNSTTLGNSKLNYEFKLFNCTLFGEVQVIITK